MLCVHERVRITNINTLKSNFDSICDDVGIAFDDLPPINATFLFV